MAEPDPKRPRALTYGAIVLAAGASLATSQPEWEVKHAPITGSVTLTAEKPEAKLHFSVASSHRQRTTFKAKITRMGGDRSSDVAVHLRHDRSASLPLKPPIANAPRFAGGTKDVATAWTSERCTTPPCRNGYTVTLVLDAADPGESARLDWTMKATVGDKGSSDVPKGAFIRAANDSLFPAKAPARDR